MSSIRNWLLARSHDRFGNVSLFVLLCCSLVLACSPFEFASGARNEVPATLFFWLPDVLLGSQVFFFSVRVLLAVFTLLWMLRKWVPWSSLVTVLLFTLMWSLRMENVTNGAHIFNITNWLLLIYAAWEYFCRDLRASAGMSATEVRTYPRWVFVRCLFYIGWFHSLAGFTKVWHSGFGWGDGHSLQLWVELFGWKSSPFSQLIQFDSRLTAVMQTGALLLECACIFVVFHRWLRYAIGLGLFGYYLGVLTSFIDFGFHANAILVALFLLPVDRWLGLEFEGRGKV